MSKVFTDIDDLVHLVFVYWV